MSKALAIALIFWCAGAGCIVVSYAQVAMRDVVRETAADAHMTHVTGSMDAHACCKAKRRGAKRSGSAEQSNFDEFTQFTVPPPIKSDAMSCCPLTTGSIVVASRSTNDEASALSLANSSAFKLLTSEQKPLAVPLRLPNRAESYLLDCVFLI